MRVARDAGRASPAEQSWRSWPNGVRILQEVSRVFQRLAVARRGDVTRSRPAENGKSTKRSGKHEVNNP
jgi:hypothetical protein